MKYFLICSLLVNIGLYMHSRSQFHSGWMLGQESINQCLAKNYALKPEIPWKGIGQCWTQDDEWEER